MGRFALPFPERDTETSPLELCGESVYCFLMSDNWAAKIIAVSVIWLQIFFFSGAIHISKTAVETIPERPWFAAVTLSVYIAPSMVRGLQLVFYERKGRSRSIPITGIFHVVVGFYSVAASWYYAGAESDSDSEFLVNILTLLFIEQVDEQVYLVLKHMSPNWFQKEIDEIEKEHCSGLESEQEGEESKVAAGKNKKL